MGADMPRSSEETMEVDMRTIIDADLGRDDADLELNGETMAANAAAYAGREAREQRQRPTARPACVRSASVEALPLKDPCPARLS